MAKTSSVNRNNKRKDLSKRLGAKRAALKAIAGNRNGDPQERFEATLKLAQMPRNSARIRVRNRCALTGRPRGYFRKFDLCRNALRKLASVGELPGVTKSSW